ncbi:hypothetical protein MINTM008_34160 [Mycobacterium intracellulare]|nr:hypothetical protein MINTM008_34160 [Mycobacterium intracellulare]BCO79527.1 hypothetical protein MINTM009_33090 [Mycobacterium intracellulare]BCP43456.1 hypothetical protein MINTMi27_35490 [Mycobacterium intracellulare]
MTYAMSSGDGSGSPVAGWVAMAGSSTSMMCPANAPNRGRTSAVVTAAIGSASVSMNSTRTVGSAGSIGTYAAPVLRTARIATIASADRGIATATRWPGAAPQPISLCANRFVISYTSR